MIHICLKYYKKLMKHFIISEPHNNNNRPDRSQRTVKISCVRKNYTQTANRL